MFTKTLIAAAILVASATAPAYAAGTGGGSITFNGTSLNGMSLQGVGLNGLRTNGLRANGLRANGLNVGGHQGVGLNGQVIAIEF